MELPNKGHVGVQYKFTCSVLCREVVLFSETLNILKLWEKHFLGDPGKITRGNAKSGAVVKHQRKLVVLKTTSNVHVKAHFKSGFAPLYCSLVTSLGTSSNVPCR